MVGSTGLPGLPTGISEPTRFLEPYLLNYGARLNFNTTAITGHRHDRIAQRDGVRSSRRPECPAAEINEVACADPLGHREESRVGGEEGAKTGR
jgi:hypothetical protein